MIHIKILRSVEREHSRYTRFFSSGVSLAIICLMLLFVGVCVANAASPTITEYWNWQTRDDSTSFTIELKHLNVFRVIADQDIDTWHWYINGIETTATEHISTSDNNTCYFSWRAGPEDKDYTISVNGENANGTTNTITWNIHIPPLGYGNISGTVTDKDTGNPIEGANITLQGITSIIEGTWSTITNDSGNYNFTNLKEGDYLLTISKGGYNHQTEYIEVIANQTATQDFQLIPYTPATISYDGTKILISDGTATLTTINTSLNDSTLLEQLSAKEWLLKVPIKIQNTGILYINNDDCDWLKLLSMNDSNEAYILNHGTLEIRNTKITSWNTSTNAPAPRTDSTRAYIFSYLGVQLRIISCNLSDLGCSLSPSHYEYGLGTACDSNGALLVNVTISNNWRGMEISTNNSKIINCEVFHNVDVGIGVGFRHFPLSGLKFKDVTIYENEKENFETQFTWSDIYILTDSEIINMTSHTGYGNLITIRHSKNVTIRDSTAYSSGYLGGWHSGFDIHTYNDNILVENCESWDVQTPFFTHNYNTNVTFRNCVARDIDKSFEMQGGCTNNRLENCITYNTNGFSIHSSSENQIVNCIAYDCSLGVNLYPFNWTGWPGGIFTEYNETWTCYGNVFRNCEFSDNDVNYRFETLPQSHERYLDYSGVNYIYNPVEQSVEITKSIDAHPTVHYHYYDGKVFKVDSEWIPCYTNGSYKEWALTGDAEITAYNLCAVPSSGEVTITINKFNTSLPAGQILVNFTANTTDGNNVVFTVWSLKPSHYYLIKRDGINFTTKQANSSGYIQFSNSEWSTRTFTIEESAPAMGNISGIVTDKDTGLPIEKALIKANSHQTTTNSTGGYTISLEIGNYTVTALKTGYYPNSTTAQVLENQTTTIDFILTRHKRKLPVAKPVCATGIAILIVIAYWRYRRRRRRMRSGGFIVLVPGITGEWIPFLYN